ncbi:TBC1 domain family member 12-like isoform X3 [Seriola aureovittata]|uniref:TBC1 domain family member 12-like isoform X3 n=1 Tax=Seriola aureovittata TaxID=2871759 RepID=UPI0024BEAB59|nr:TBC1 domain family member 12-like isoform X3 [Seriola aureovittata]XP_056222532.1 TBC1 domain family member 12-like isoform X3 [Seriola aureovittata]
MERNDDSSPSATVTNTDESSPCHHHHHHHHHHHEPVSHADVITRGHTPHPAVQCVKCSADRKENLVTCSHHSGSDCGQRGPIRSSSDVKETGDDEGAGSYTINDVTNTSYTDRFRPNVETNRWCPDSVASRGSMVNPHHWLEGLCGGGSTRGTDHHLDIPAPSVRSSKASQVNVNPVTLTSDSGPLEGDVTFDLLKANSDEAFITELSPGPPTTAPRSRNTFECGRRQSAPGDLAQDDCGGSESELQSRMPGIVEYLSSRRQQSVSHSVAGWKLFGKVPPRQSPSKQARTIQQEFEARSSPSHHAAGQQSRRKVEFEPLSTTALILEDRPPNLPAKSAEETQRHRQQYEQMVAGAKRRELKEAQRRQQQMKERFRQEEEISNATMVWNQHILPHWESMRSSRRAQDLWWGGLPSSIRGRVWCLAISNELNITAELYEIFLSRAKEKWIVSKTETDDTASLSDRESSLELITQDVSRTFPSLCVFQQGGPYHDLLQSILGAYTCYRPDVGYVTGMSSIAAVLILNMDEVEAFISFSNLINRPCQLAFYRVDQPLMYRYFGAFQVFLEETLPHLFLYFQSVGVTPDLYLLDWILSLYTKPLPLDVACRVWDVFFRDGEEFLFRTALGILRLYQNVLLHMDLISIAQFLSRLPDEELLSDRLFSCILAMPMQSGNRKWSQVLSSCSS